ncbi:hypothetical protein BT93_A1132 [Corymbia citriodora subsp. variegata]|nr:hypothetical protein BT93_A1132 [Corymbia citriodora subsp. variegata]
MTDCANLCKNDPNSSLLYVKHVSYDSKLQIHPSNLPSKHESILKNPNCRIPFFFFCTSFTILNSKMKMRIHPKKKHIECYINDFYFSFNFYKCLMLTFHFVLILLQRNNNHLIS